MDCKDDCEAPEVSVKCDGRGFLPSDQLYRSCIRVRGCPEGGSAAECERVVSIGGDYISRECSLGKNVEGTQELVVPAMAAGEKLIAVPRGRHESVGSAASASAKELCMTHGRNDVAGCAAWKRADGSFWPDHYNDECALRVFCDNVVIETPCVAGIDGKSDIFAFMRLAGLRTQVRTKEDLVGSEDAERMSGLFSISKCGVVRGRERWKVMIADVPLHTVKLLVSLLGFAELHRVSQVCDFQEELRVLMSECSDAVTVRGLTMVALLHAAEVAQRLFLLDVDLAVDSSGTLNSDALKAAPMIRSGGHEVLETTASGLNCVYLKGFVEDGVNVKLKVYNKTMETMQQGRVRSTEPADKCGYLLNPSTKRLSDLSWDSDYYDNGMTRLELTLSRVCSADGFPDFDWLVGLCEAWRRVLAEPGVLVSCSVHDQIKHMGTFVGRSVVVYFPHVSEAKCNHWEEQHKCVNGKARKQLKKQIREVPDGFLLRWHNSLTGKFNGYPIHGNFTGRGVKGEMAWELTSKALAWGSSCGKDPVLFICVAGDLQSELSSMFFRMIGINRSGGPLSTYLPWHCCYRRDNFKNHLVDFERVGVCANEQDNLRFKVVGRVVKPSFLTMGTLDISLSGELATEADVWTIVDSEERAVVTGVPRQYHQVSDHNGALSAWKAWTSYKICCVGKDKTKKIRFQVGSDWFWAPNGIRGLGAASKQLIEHLEGLGSPATVCEVLMDSGNNFRWREGVVASGSKVVGRCHSARALPVDEKPYAILGSGLQREGRKTMMYVWVEAGRFYIPQSIREQVFAALSIKATDGCSDEAINSFLKGKLILHAAARFERVLGLPNCEELLVIVDDSGVVVASNIYDGQKRQCR
jgi:hypothetical protein